MYIGTKRIAPKTDERKEAVRFSKNKKSRKKDGLQFQGNTLPRTGRRDHIYSSVNDEVSSTLSEGKRKRVLLVIILGVKITTDNSLKLNTILS